MSETYTNGGGRSDYRLPTVNANDNGKILKVVEGEWKKAEGGGSGGGGDVMTVIISDGASSVSESIEDILLAISSGKSVIAVYDDSYTCLLSYDNNISGVSGVALESFDSGTAGCYVISGYNDGTSDVWNVGEYSYSSGGGGLTLYGPFVFYVDELNPVSVLAGGTENVPLPSIKDYDGHTFTLSGLSSDAVFVLQSFGTSGNGLLCAKIVEPYYFNASWSAPSGYVTNVSDVQQSIQSDSDFFVQFMCTEQLSEAT